MTKAWKQNINRQEQDLKRMVAKHFTDKGFKPFQFLKNKKSEDIKKDFQCYSIVTFKNPQESHEPLIL